MFKSVSKRSAATWTRETRGTSPSNSTPNIKIAIKLYEDGKIDGLEHVYIMDGVVVTQKEAFEGSAWVWSEVYISLSNSVPRTHLINGLKSHGVYRQFAQKFA
jgi:hypothetical protein